MKRPIDLTPEQRQAVQAEVNSFREDMRSTPPPPALSHAKGRVLECIPRDQFPSGEFRVEELERQMRAAIERQAEERLAEEIERRRAAEMKLEAHRRFWADVMKGVVTALIIATVLFIVRQLVSK